ncbi:hypothetical protein [Abyssalbus ytuae]|uniref:Uncharacterized protein n=1 Tax=Abyssalbus ytuae TaxID=2926907 RepID=A0A9E6ZPZ1_9FLAO|nr:hypothetical protein [Abyssalbus ytuae]UOB18420.1 hypothetical protein MQE35_03810 [Abyssalbus ytuae]
MRENNLQESKDDVIKDIRSYLNNTELNKIMPVKNPVEVYLVSRLEKDKNHVSNYLERMVNGLFQAQMAHTYAAYIKRKTEKFETLEKEDIQKLQESIKKFSKEIAVEVGGYEITKSDLERVRELFVAKEEFIHDRILKDAMEAYILLEKSKGHEEELKYVNNKASLYEGWLEILENNSNTPDMLQLQEDVVGKYLKFKQLDAGEASFKETGHESVTESPGEYKTSDTKKENNLFRKFSIPANKEEKELRKPSLNNKKPLKDDKPSKRKGFGRK